MATKKSFLDVVRGRRSVYALNDKSPVDDADIVDLLNETMMAVPSSFNVQSVRTILLCGEQHKHFWQVALNVQVGNEKDEERKKRVQGRIASFQAAYGTVVFLDDVDTVAKAKQDYAAYAGLFDEWSAHSQGMHQFVLWAALEAEGFGANLQHLNYDAALVAKWAEQFEIPKNWKPYAQLVFGGRVDAQDPPAKDKLPLEETTKIMTSRIVTH